MSDVYEYDLFISHSSEDKKRILPLIEGLRAHGLKLWFDHADLKPGEAIPHAIMNGFRQSRRAVFFLSKSSVESEWLHYEIKLFMLRDPSNELNTVIPVKINDCLVPIIMKGIHVLELTGENDRDIAPLIKITQHKKSRLFVRKSKISLSILSIIALLITLWSIIVYFVFENDHDNIDLDLAYKVIVVSIFYVLCVIFYFVKETIRHAGIGSDQKEQTEPQRKYAVSHNDIKKFYEVLIIHSKEDASVVGSVVCELEDLGVSCLYLERRDDIDHDGLPEYLDDMVSRCRRSVYFISKNSNNINDSRWVYHELTFSIQREKTPYYNSVIDIYIDGSENPFLSDGKINIFKGDGFMYNNSPRDCAVFVKERVYILNKIFGKSMSSRNKHAIDSFVFSSNWSKNHVHEIISFIRANNINIISDMEIKLSGLTDCKLIKYCVKKSKQGIFLMPINSTEYSYKKYIREYKKRKIRKNELNSLFIREKAVIIAVKTNNSLPIPSIGGNICVRMDRMSRDDNKFNGNCLKKLYDLIKRKHISLNKNYSNFEVLFMLLLIFITILLGIWGGV